MLYPPGLVGGYRNQVMRFIALVKHALTQNISQLLTPSLMWSTRYYDLPSDRSPMFWPIQFRDLFDVEHWNHQTLYGNRHNDNDKNSSLSTTTKTTRIQLPLLVDSIQNADCWGDKRDPRIADEQQQDWIPCIFPNYKNSSDVLGNNNLDTCMPELTIDMLRNRNTTSLTSLFPTANASMAYLVGQEGKAGRQLDLASFVNHCQRPSVYGGGRGGKRVSCTG